MQHKKFISARPERDNGTTSNGSYDFGTSLHLRASAERQENLQAYGYHLTKCENLRVNLDPNAKTASIQNYDENDQPTVITIPTFDHEEAAVENPFPDLDDEEFYAMLQYAEMIHEGGHYEHTDQPSVNTQFDKLQKRLGKYPFQLQKFLAELCKDLWNAIEDGAMEEAIRNERGPKAAQRLAIKNETFIAQGTKSYPEQVTQNVTFDFALHMAAMDIAKYDTGALRRLLDDEDPSWQFNSDRDEDLFMELYPALRQTVEDSMITANPAARTERIFDFLHDVVDAIEDEIGSDIDQKETAGQEREQLREGQTDDTENQSGQAQTQQSEGLQQNKREEVAQQHANQTQQTVTSETPDAGDEQDGADGESGNADQQDGDGQQQQDGDGQQSDAGQSQDGADGDSQPGESGDASGDDSAADGEQSSPGESGDSGSESGDSSNGEVDGDATTGSEERGAGGGETDESDPICPSCGSTDTGRLVQQVDGMIAARVNAPFDITADWVDSITFVSDDEVCGFRVATSGAVPTASIEQNGYKVVDVSDGVEILEPRSRYGETESVKGFDCESCGHAWVPTIGGDSA